MNKSSETSAQVASRSRERPWVWFCGYCAATPANASELADTRVCPKCGLGLLLEAPEEAVPSKRNSFFDIDPHFELRALSMSAERLLNVAEPDVVGAPVDSLLPMSAQRGRLLETLKLATTGDETVRRASVLLGDGLGAARARITACGPVPSALIVLERVPAGT